MKELTSSTWTKPDCFTVCRRTIACRQLSSLKENPTRITIALCANADRTEKRSLVSSIIFRGLENSNEKATSIMVSITGGKKGLDDESVF